MKAGRSASLGFETLRREGALLLPDVLEKAAQGSASRQSAEDYLVPRGLTLQQEIGRAFRIALAQWNGFSATLERADLDAGAATRAFAGEFLRDALGYAAPREKHPGRRAAPPTKSG